jgi:undecaprenyl diphosphate synthase
LDSIGQHSIKDSLDLNNLPLHIAIIMDGNGRWAQLHGRERVFGHENGVRSVREAAEGCAEIGVKYLTLYAFSTENWKRPVDEVNALMQLLVYTIKQELPTLQKNAIRLRAIGNLQSLPKDCLSELNEAMELTAANDRMTLILALSYSSKWEIVEAARKMAIEAVEGRLKPEEIDADLLSQHLTTAAYPDPELLIRTSGEHRISNFLLWQIAYSELYFTDKLWPDFDREALYEAIVDYQQRERRFGLTSDQIQTTTS